MKKSYVMLTVGLLVTGVLGFAFPWSELGTVASVRAEEPTKKIEIVAKDKEWKVSGYTLKDEPTEIVVRNEDTVVHGFSSSLFKDVKVKVEGDGYLAKGMGPNVYRVEPGKTMILHFNKPSTGTGEGSATYAFWCDLHPNMKGEMFVLSLRGQGGG
jgi:plastocyanin